MENDEVLFDAPIPGENYTSDTKNYPWHRPPDIIDYDEGIEFAIQTLTEEEIGFTYMAMLEGGMDVATATDLFVTLGISKGKWTPDYAILLAGPISRLLEIMAKSYGLNPEIGIDRKAPLLTGAYMKALREEGAQTPVEDPGAMLEGDPSPMAAPPTGGLMGAPMDAPAGPDEQLSMLGYGPEEPPMPEQEVL